MSKRLKTQAEFIADQCCPRCDNSDVEYSNIDPIWEAVTIDVICLECTFKYRERYVLFGYEVSNGS